MIDTTNQEAYVDWIDSNTDFLIECYGEQLEIFPDSVYEGVLDDDYPDAEDRYVENLTIQDIPDEFIQDMYDSWCETRGE